MRDRFFEWLGTVTYRFYWAVLIVSLALTVVLGGLAGKLRVETSWTSMLDSESESVQSFERIIDEFGAATNIVLAFEGPDEECVTRSAADVVPRLLDLTIEYVDDNGVKRSQPAFRRADFQYDVEYLANHGLMLEKAKNLRKNKALFTDYNLGPFLTHVNDVYEEQWVSDSDNLTKQEKDAERGLDGMFQLFATLNAAARREAIDSALVQHGVDRFTVGSGYYLSSDKKMALAYLTPTMSVNEIPAAVAAVDSLNEALDRLIEAHPGVQCAATGMHVVLRDEMHAGVDDTVRNFGLAIVLILVLFVVSFRMWSGPLLAMMVLITGITWDLGLAQLVYGKLNILSAVCSVILIGLGVDFAIHIISAYTELRHKGRSVERAIAEAYQKVGGGLVTGALTTAIAFLAITLLGSQAFREFGFVVGVGIICCLVSSLFLLPAAIVAKDRLWQKIRTKAQPKALDMEFHSLGRLAETCTARPWVTIGVAIVVTAALAAFIPQARMNDNYMDLEPEGLASVRLQREISKRFHMSPDNLLAVYESVEQANEVQDLLNSRPSVGMVESIASVLPSRAKQEERRTLVAEIRRQQHDLPKERPVELDVIIEQLYRLSDNITEISSMAYVSGLDRVFERANSFIGLDEEGDQVGPDLAAELAAYLEAHPDAEDNLTGYQSHFRKIMTARAYEMSDTTTLTLDMVPESYRERYVSKDSSHFLVAFYSKKDIWDRLFTSPFLQTMLRSVPEATGSPVFMREIVDARKRDGLTAFGIALLAILALLLVDFRSLKTALVTLLPLLMASVWLLGLMGLFDIRFTIINVIGFPLLIGIGIDDGVHVVHRYRIEGKRKLAYTMASIGKPILLTSITTILGFASLMSSDYRGYVGLGVIVALGIGLCFVASVVILPAVMKLVYGGSKSGARFFR